MRINIDEKTCQHYDNIKTLSAFLEMIMENSTRMIKKTIETIENRLFTLKLEDRGTVSSYYDEMQILCDDLDTCRQPKPTDQQKYQNLMGRLPTAWSDYKRVLKWYAKDDDYLSLLLKLENYEKEIRQAKWFKSGRSLRQKRQNSDSKIAITYLRSFVIIVEWKDTMQKNSGILKNLNQRKKRENVFQETLDNQNRLNSSSSSRSINTSIRIEAHRHCQWWGYMAH